MSSFYNQNELRELGLKRYGENVLISRYSRIYKPDVVEIGSNVRIDDFVVISGGLGITIGNYVHISCYAGLWGNRGLVIGDFSSVSIGTRILTETDDYTGCALVGATLPSKYRKLIGMPMRIGKYVNIGMNCTILPIAEIPDGCALGAGCLLNKIPDAWSIYIGIPARKLKDRLKDLLELEQQLLSNNHPL